MNKLKKAKKKIRVNQNEQYVREKDFQIAPKYFYKMIFDNTPRHDDEEWRDIVGYEGLYKISNYGVVINKNYRVIGTYYGDDLYDDLIKYNCVTLVKNGKSKKYDIHRLVALTFVPNPNPSEFNIVNHIDENKHNNYYKNLEWCTTAYNLHYGNAEQKRRETLELKKEYGI